MTAMDAASLLAWFSQHRRSFPWRTPFPRDPYLVLVSELMLQQTQASRVAELLPVFLQRFPNLDALAQASEDEVVAAFAGLGYYRRARLLQRLAREVKARGWPRHAKALQQLPGVGPYTAAAVASFAFGELTPPVDANLCRITARVYALPLAAGTPALHLHAHQLAYRLAEESGSPEVFEALMELGATVCTPQRPRCPVCPWVASCAAFRSGKPTAFPRPKKQRPQETPTWVALWVENSAGQVLLRQLTGPPLLGLWLPPLDRGEGDPHRRAQALAQEVGCSATPRLVGSVRHHITHRRITVMLFRAQPPASVREPAHGLQWALPSAFLPTSSLSTKLAHLASKTRPEEVTA